MNMVKQPLRYRLTDWFGLYALLLVVLTLCSSCASHTRKPGSGSLMAYTAAEKPEQASRHVPVFIIENPDAEYNRIGSPAVSLAPDGSEEVFVDHRFPAIFMQKDTFQTQQNNYTNYIYRIHFKEVPFSLIPFYLGAGKNVGLIVVATFDRSGNPVLYTTVNTCGCYLAFIPTSYMPKEAFPESWPMGKQSVYGEMLPSLLHYPSQDPGRQNIMILLRNGTHRVKDMWLAGPESAEQFKTVHAGMFPMEDLEKLQVTESTTTSFYVESGAAKGFVKESLKIWERLLMGWWAFDWRVGEDKKLGSSMDDPPVFYTSLKPWARSDSDMRAFASFLAYWGWNL